jgi:hypothetical protein
MKLCTPARPARQLAALLCALLLSACATNPDRLALGLSEAQVIAASGQPSNRVGLPDGGSRLVYNYQPAGQEIYHADFDAQGRLVRSEQVLDEAVFARLAPAIERGALRGDEVRAQFGKPAETSQVYSFKGVVWSYRYRQNGINRLWHVHIDPQGVVRRAYSTDERRGPNNFFRL